MKRTYEFTVRFYSTYGTFDVEAENCDEAYDKAKDEIRNALADLPVEVEFEVDCENWEDDEEEEK